MSKVTRILTPAFPEESEHVRIDVDEIPSYAVLFNEDFKC